MRYLSGVATLSYSPDKCTGCRRCIEVCPHGVFLMEGKKAVVRDRDLCMECGACAQNCESGAVSVHTGVGCAAAIINGMITGGEPSCGCSTDGSGCC